MDIVFKIRVVERLDVGRGWDGMGVEWRVGNGKWRVGSGEGELVDKRRFANCNVYLIFKMQL